MDECAIDSDDCVDGATCINTAGSFTCSCPPGFSGDGRANGTLCQGMRICMHSLCVGVTMCERILLEHTYHREFKLFCF